ncbi:hypothetical protein Sjap_011345 [Stephania japonica]|uniref:Serine incorporator n=1 Tax=Stephania japonica TaxID=461633 RepID=A0AAP0JBC2_9MAGN
MATVAEYRIKVQEEEKSMSSSNKSIIRLMEYSWFSQFYAGPNPWMARYVYGLIFLAANLLAWAIRDYGQSALTEVKRLKECHGGSNCLGTEGVLRVSLGCFVSSSIDKTFYITMFLSTVGTKRLHGNRDAWHSGWWSAKIVMCIGLMVLPFFLPTTLIHLYGEIAHFGAGIFLLIQLISIISFIMWLNKCCHSEKCARDGRFHVKSLSMASYVTCIVGVILLYIWYAPQLSCILNILFITVTLLLLHLMTLVSLNPRINAGLLAPGLMGLYIVFICWCAIRSEPPTETCNKNLCVNACLYAVSDKLIMVSLSFFLRQSFVIAVLAMVIATFSTGIDSESFQFRKDEKQGDDDVPYGYGFFHFVFAMGAMYFAMLLIGWNTHHIMKKWTIDVGWTSTWVRIVNEWLAACVYSKYLFAPAVYLL